MIKNTKTAYQFEPKYHNLDLLKLKNEQADDLLKESSYNFKLTGFTFKSRVGYYSSEEFQDLPEGREGLEVELTRASEGGVYEVVKSLKSAKNGLYEFANLMPGSYKVEVIGSPDVQFVSRTMQCEFSWENGQNCQGKIMLSGSDMNGRVSVAGDQYQGCLVVLKSVDNLDIPSCAEDQDLEIPEGVQVGDYDCITITDETGLFSFENIPHGKYNIRMVDGDQDGIEFENGEYVQGHNLNLSSEMREFKLDGSIKKLVSRVTTPGGKPIKGVSIVIDGEQIGTTSSKGELSIVNLKIGEYDIEAIHPHYSFKALRVKLNANSRREGQNPVNPLVADYMKLCGKIDYTQTETESTTGYKVQVKLVKAVKSSDEESGRTEQVRATVAKQDGSYCFDVPQGVYVVKPTIIFDGKKFNVKPKERKISVENEPALGVDFSREKLSIKGKIQVFENVNQEFVQMTTISLFNAAGSKVTQKSWDELEGGVFEFEDLFEETYEIKLENPRLCFNTNSIKTDENSGNTVFKQTGILVSYTSDFQFQLQIKARDGSEDTVNLQKGNNQMCLGYQGQIDASVSDEYLLKNGMNSFVYDTESTEELVFEIEMIKAHVKTKVETKKIKKLLKSMGNEGETIMDHFTMEVVDVETQQVFETASSIKKGVITSTFYSPPQTQLEITPKILSSEILERLVILQKTRKFKISNKYNPKIQSSPFEVSVGRRIFIQTDKEIDGVKLVLNRRKNKDEFFKQYNTQKIDLSQKILGTYSGNFDYSIELQRQGYEFEIEKEVSGNQDIVFKISTVQISQLVIRIKDPKGKAMRGVTAYITSAERGKALKIVEQTDKNGEITKDIYKGKYYVKAFLKEYEFNPPQKMFSVGEGEVFELDIIATRTRFSAFGVVRNFGGFDVSDIEIEAISDDEENPFSETAVSDKNGKFRIMGLIPGKTYNIKIKTQSNNIIIPEYYEVTIEDQDFSSNDFILAEKWNLLSVQGKVAISEDIALNDQEKLLPLKLKLTEILSEEEQEEYTPEVKEVLLRNFRQFEFIDLDFEATYRLELFTGKSTEPIYSKDLASKTLTRGLNVLEDIVIKRSDLNIIEVEKSSSNILVVLLLVAGAFYYNFNMKKN